MAKQPAFLVADIGGTKVYFALFSVQTFKLIHLATYASQSYATFNPIAATFLKESAALNYNVDIQAACFAAAGPIHKGICKTTNLPWVLDTKKLSSFLKVPKLFMINDLEANAYSIAILKKSQKELLFPGEKKGVGNQAILSPGTGLGEAGLYWDGSMHHPFACEGGHCDFAPQNDLQIELLLYLSKRFKHVSYERILSGPGLLNLFAFFKEYKEMPVESLLEEEMHQGNPAAALTKHALQGDSEICHALFDLFIAVLGAEIGNLALKFFSTGGIYLGGGILPRIVPLLKQELFTDSLLSKGRFNSLIESIPITLILDSHAALLGAAHYCALRL